MIPPASRVGPFDLVVFGGAGDLALRKLMPALFHRERDGQLPAECRVIGAARTAMGDAEYRARIEAACRAAVPDFDAETWDRFARRLHYARIDARDGGGFAALKPLLAAAEGQSRIFYLATSPELFGVICRHAEAAGLIGPRTRVVLEKPIGHDLESSRAINDEVGRIVSEDRIYRIDHYLGKETVQNLMALRFANRIFERLWHAGEVDHIEITVAEQIGIEGRGAYYDAAGALRDMVQNHMLQLLCLIAMEPPLRFDSNAVRDEKVKVLQALKPIGPTDVKELSVRGQYIAGASDAKPVPGYLAELGRQDSATETFVAIKAAVENWRWAGVPFYLRSGKRLPVRRSEIIVQFRAVPHLIFTGLDGDVTANRLSIRLQPDEGMQLVTMAKVPGPGGMRLRQAALNLSFAEEFKDRAPDAYERLLMDVARGNPTLFMRRDEVEAAWRWIEPILEGWHRAGDRPRPYTAGSWGPAASAGLMARDGRAWGEESG
jgi:glucose-6-phosphate 1-dehydrogenase